MAKKKKGGWPPFRRFDSKPYDEVGAPLFAASGERTLREPGTKAAKGGFDRYSIFRGSLRPENKTEHVMILIPRFVPCFPDMERCYIHSQYGTDFGGQSSSGD
jgi:hypothetical protein